jgi:hypothetical protein
MADMQEVLATLRDKGAKAAEPQAEELREKYLEGAALTKGGECSGCASCAGCLICGPTAIQAIQVGHTFQAFHT